MKISVFKNATSEEIQEATFKLLSEKGYSAISMRDIARMSGKSLGQLTYYFRSKESLIADVIDGIITEVVNTMSQILNQGENKLELLSGYWYKLITEDTKVFKVIADLSTQSIWNPKLKEKMEKFYNEIISVMSECLDTSKDKKIVEKGIVLFISTMFYNSMHNETYLKKMDTAYIENILKEI